MTPGILSHPYPEINADIINTETLNDKLKLYAKVLYSFDFFIIVFMKL